VDEVLETINKLSSSAAVVLAETPRTFDTAQTTVIVTPKKRHKVEEEVTSVAEKVVPQPRRRLSSKGSLSGKKDMKNGVGKKKGKEAGSDGKRQLRSAVKVAEPINGDIMTPLHVDLPVLTVQNLKAISPNSDSLEMATLTPVSDITPLKPTPAVGIFEPSENAVAIDSSILVPLCSPSEMCQNLKGTLSKKIKPSKPDLNDTNSTASSTKLSDVRVSLINHSELLMKNTKVIAKLKVKRRKMFNRTGFPRKKKKKLNSSRESKESKTVDDAVINFTDEKVENKTDGVQKKLTTEQTKTDDVPKKLTTEQTKTDEVPKKSITEQIEQKLNLSRKQKRVNGTVEMAPNSKKRKVDRVLRQKVEEVETVTEESAVEVSVPVPAPIRKRKRSCTIKNTKSKLKSRYQLPLLSMKKFKKSAKEPEKSDRYFLY